MTKVVVDTGGEVLTKAELIDASNCIRKCLHERQGFTESQALAIFEKINQTVAETADQASLLADIFEVVAELKRRGKKLAVVSSSP